MYTNADMTLYSKEYDSVQHLDKWVKYEVNNVFWDNCKGSNVNKSGMDSADSVSVFVPLFNMPVIPKIGDYIVEGIVDDEFTKITDLTKKYPNSYVITKVDKKDFGSNNMRHWELGGK